jgi:hypothetical protein
MFGMSASEVIATEEEGDCGAVGVLPAEVFEEEFVLALQGDATGFHTFGVEPVAEGEEGPEGGSGVVRGRQGGVFSRRPEESKGFGEIPAVPEEVPEASKAA